MKAILFATALLSTPAVMYLAQPAGSHGVERASPVAERAARLGRFSGGALSERGLIDHLIAAAPNDRIRLLVRPAPDTGKRLTAETLRAHGIETSETFHHVASTVIEVTPDQLIILLENELIGGVSEDHPIGATLYDATVAVGADIVRQGYGYQGNGVVVAVADSGVGEKEMPGEAKIDVKAQYDFTSGQSRKEDKVDPLGHGTHVAGIIAGKVNGDGTYEGLSGIAPRADVVSLRVLDAQGRGTVSDLLRAIDWAIEHQAQERIRILNLSLGHPVYESWRTDPLCAAVAAAHQAGILVVASAGNYGREGSGFGRISSPGNCPYALTVGAVNGDGTVTTNDDVMATYSSRGPSAIDLVVKPDLVAPGNRIQSLRVADSAYDQEMPDNRGGRRKRPGQEGKEDDSRGFVFTLSGTSMAAPAVAGAAALLLEAEPTLTPDDLKARLMMSARPFGDGGVLVSGAGYLDVAAALTCTAQATDESLSPTLRLEGDLWTVEPTGIQPGASGVASWESETGEADMLLYGDQLLWGDMLLWGEGVLTGDQILWGDQILYADSLVSEAVRHGDATGVESRAAGTRSRAGRRE